MHFVHVVRPVRVAVKGHSVPLDLFSLHTNK
jgi:hypothetical protein